MKVIIIGNGVAGQITAEQLRKLDSDIEIQIFTEEAVSYYSRIHLPEYVANERPLEKLILKKQDWYQEKNIQPELDSRVVQINPQEKKITIGKNDTKLQEVFSYDKLVLATGSSARKISFGAPPQISGMFALRNISDADQIKEYIVKKTVKNAVIIGGGLLGIELAYHLRSLIPNVTICEIADYLLPRQLDRETSKILCNYLKIKGLNIICGKKIQNVLGDSIVEGILLDDGTKLETPLIFQQLGIIPNISLAKKAGLTTARGIVVNHFLQTNDSSIYAVGDCVEFEGLIWGIIPACMEQAKIAAKSIMNLDVKPYSGTFWNTRLKIAGLNISCIGISPKELKEGILEVKSIDHENFLCRKVFIAKNKLKGAIIVGDSKDTYFRRNMNQEVSIEEVKKKINEKNT